MLSLGLRARATDLPPYAFDLRRPRVQRLDIALSACCALTGITFKRFPPNSLQLDDDNDGEWGSEDDRTKRS